MLVAKLAGTAERLHLPLVITGNGAKLKGSPCDVDW
jgi:hypothetical protein